VLAKTHESNIRVRRKALRDKDFDEINQGELNSYTNTPNSLWKGPIRLHYWAIKAISLWTMSGQRWSDRQHCL